MRILLVSLNRLATPYPVYPLGLDHVAGALSDRHEARVLDLCNVPIGAEEGALAEAVASHRPQAIGISIRNVDNTDAADQRGFLGDMRRVVLAAKKASQVPVILGGAGYTLFPDQLLEELHADFGVVGEGERLSPLLDALEDKKPVEGLEGIAVRGRPSALPEPFQFQGQRAAPSQNPNLDFYLRKGGMLNLQTKRGCPFLCIYCTYPNIEGRRVRGSDAEQIAKQALELEKCGGKYFFITDSVFNSDVKQSLEVADALASSGLTIPWGAFFSPRRTPPDYYQRLKAAGCQHLEFGTDSISESILKRLRKPFRVKEILEAHRQAIEAGIHVAHFLALGAPDESEATIAETLDNAEKLDGAAIFFFCGLRIYPSTQLYDIALERGQVKPGQNLLEPVYYRPEGIALEDITVRVEERAKNHPNWIVGSGGDRKAALIDRMYAKGKVGPLWEILSQI